MHTHLLEEKKITLWGKCFILQQYFAAKVWSQGEIGSELWNFAQSKKNPRKNGNLPGKIPKKKSKDTDLPKIKNRKKPQKKCLHLPVHTQGRSQEVKFSLPSY